MGYLKLLVRKKKKNPLTNDYQEGDESGCEGDPDNGEDDVPERP